MSANESPIRTAVPGISLGVVALAAVAGFAIGLPELVGDAEAASSDRVAPAEVLPEAVLDDSMVRAEEVAPGVGDQVEAYGGEQLTDLFGEDAAVATYLTPDGQSQLSLIVSDAGGDFFLLNGPPVPPEMSQTQSTQTSSRVVDGVPCTEVLANPAQQGAPTEPLAVQCQTDVDGRTFVVYTGGMSAETAVEALREAIDLDAAQDQ